MPWDVAMGGSPRANGGATRRATKQENATAVMVRDLPAASQAAHKPATDATKAFT